MSKKKRKNFSEWRDDEWGHDDLNERKRYKKTKRRVDEARKAKKQARDKFFEE